MPCQTCKDYEWALATLDKLKDLPQHDRGLYDEEIDRLREIVQGDYDRHIDSYDS